MVTSLCMFILIGIIYYQRYNLNIIQIVLVKIGILAIIPIVLTIIGILSFVPKTKFIGLSMTFVYLILGISVPFVDSIEKLNHFAKLLLSLTSLTSALILVLSLNLGILFTLLSFKRLVRTEHGKKVIM